jgi:NADH-quinone oxidoreductase subunit M
MPVYFSLVLIGFFASLGLPGFSGFIGEVMIFLGAFHSHTANGLIHQSFAIVATLGLVFGAAYFLWTIQRMFFGSFHRKGTTASLALPDVNAREYLMLIPLACAALVFGIFPQLLLRWINPFAQHFAEEVLQAGQRIFLNP